MVTNKTLTIKRADWHDIVILAETMRDSDLRELKRYSELSVHAELSRCLSVSDFALTAFIDGDLAAMWGLSMWSLMAGQGSPWCYTTPVVEDNKRSFMKLSKYYIGLMKRRCPSLLGVHVDAEYTKAIRWLKWLGFEMEPVTIRGHAFYWATIREVQDGCSSGTGNDVQGLPGSDAGFGSGSVLHTDTGWEGCEGRSET